MEFCSLWPRFVMNSWKDDGIVNLPWMHESVIPQVRGAMTLRYRLMPYIYTQMWQASRRNEPVVRPLFYDFPNDRQAIHVQDSFMLGPDLLVAPVLEEGALDREVYLPQHEGGWFDFHDGRHVDGGQTITVAAPLGHVPVFARCGAMIPVTDQIDRIEPGLDTQRELLVFGVPADVSEAYLYEDDGDTTDWRGERRLELRFRLRRSARTSVLSVDATVRTGPLSTRFRFVRSPSMGRSGLRRQGNILISCQAQAFRRADAGAYRRRVRQQERS